MLLLVVGSCEHGVVVGCWSLVAFQSLLLLIVDLLLLLLLSSVL